MNQIQHAGERAIWPRYAMVPPAPPVGANEAPPRLIREAALFVDFDGTLAPIAARPQDVWVPHWVVPALQRLQQQLGGALALMSGRPLAVLDHLVRPLSLPGAGGHGGERRLSDGLIRLHGVAFPTVVRDAASSLVSQYPGLMLEPKRTGLALHYRAQPELKWRCLHALAAAIASEDEIADEWELLCGHCVIEIKHRRVSTARVVEAFMVERSFAGRTPVYVGDDTFDEDGIAAVQASGGFGVKVGRGETCARYRLADPEAVGRWFAASVEALEVR